VARVKFKTIQAGRAVAANAVMLSHLLIVEQKDGHGLTFLPEWSHLGACGVDLFFVLSGFIMAAIASGESWSGFLLARATRIFPPYWFYCGVVLIVALIAPGIVNGSFSHAPSVWRSFLLVPDTVDPLLAVGWTLTHEAYFYLVFAALLATGNINIGSMCGWALAVVAARLMLPVTPTQETAPVLAVLVHPLTFEFIGGACAGLAVRAGVTKGATLAVAVGVMTLITFLASTTNPSELVLTHAAQWGRVLKIGFPFVLIVYGLAATEKAGGAKHLPDWIVRLGDASYSTYLTHVLVLSAIGRCFALLPVHNTPIEIMFVALCITGTNAAGFFSYRLLERPILLLSRRVLWKGET
jgi:exopolysaccharide production protein ExoZ